MQCGGVVTSYTCSEGSRNVITKAGVLTLGLEIFLIALFILLMEHNINSNKQSKYIYFYTIFYSKPKSVI